MAENSRSVLLWIAESKRERNRESRCAIHYRHNNSNAAKEPRETVTIYFEIKSFIYFYRVLNARYLNTVLSTSKWPSSLNGNI